MNSRRKVITLILYICLILVFVIGLYFNNKKQDYLYVDNVNNVSNLNYKHVIESAKEQYKNDDVVGILEIDNTDYIVPIMQANDNNYYLKHTPNGEYSSMGSVFLDYRNDINTSKKILIYGHNSSDIDMPFKILEEFYDRDYYNNHRYVSITTDKCKKKYEIFSIFIETDDFSYMNLDYESDEEYLNHINNLKGKSMYETDISLTKDDEILILQTCSEHPNYYKYRKKYLLLVLRRM